MLASKMTMLKSVDSAAKNPATKDACAKAIATSSSIVESTLATRVFDNFPNLLSEAELEYVTKRFAYLFDRIGEIHSEDDDVIELTDQRDIDNVTDWGKEIALKGCLELLDEHGKIQADVLNKFGWKPIEHNIKFTSDIVCSYFFAVNQSLVDKLKDKVTADMHSMQKYNAINAWINHHYRIWVKEAFELLDIPYHGPEISSENSLPNFNDMVNMAYRHRAGIGVATAATAAVAVAGAIGAAAAFLLFGSSSPKPTPRNPGHAAHANQRDDKDKEIDKFIFLSL